MSVLRASACSPHLGPSAAAPALSLRALSLMEFITAEDLARARAVVLRDRVASTSHVQRALRIGYTRAMTIMSQLETDGVIGPAVAAGQQRSQATARPSRRSLQVQPRCARPPQAAASMTAAAAARQPPPRPPLQQQRAEGCSLATGAGTSCAA